MPLFYPKNEMMIKTSLIITIFIKKKIFFTLLAENFFPDFRMYPEELMLITLHNIGSFDKSKQHK